MREQQKEQREQKERERRAEERRKEREARREGGARAGPGGEVGRGAGPDDPAAPGVWAVCPRQLCLGSTHGGSGPGWRGGFWPLPFDQ